MNDKILHSAAAKLADVCGNEFGTKMHVGTLASNNEDLGITLLDAKVPNSFPQTSATFAAAEWSILSFTIA